jgi:hypothetical protein
MAAGLARGPLCLCCADLDSGGGSNPSFEGLRSRERGITSDLYTSAYDVPARCGPDERAGTQGEGVKKCDINAAACLGVSGSS